jgi:hypothetical protein
MFALEGAQAGQLGGARWSLVLTPLSWSKDLPLSQTVVDQQGILRRLLNRLKASIEYMSSTGSEIGSS